MNVLFINSIGKDKFGGGEKWMVNAAKGLTERGHNVVMASRKNSRLLKYAAEKGVQTRVMTIRGDISPLATLKIASWMKQHETDVLICNLNKDVRVAGLAARLVGRPVVLARHGMLLCSKKWKHKISLTRLTDGIITNSKTIKAAYAQYGWFDDNFVKVIYNGLNIPEHVEPFDFASRYPGKKIIYSAGRLSKQKGFEYLIIAASMLASRRNDLLFAISGEGKLEQPLKQMVAEYELKKSFIFLGFTADIYPYLKGCDLFVLPSLFEGMPNVVMEAMAMQKPVIATDVNGARELMGATGKSPECDTGLIIPSKDPEALARGIKKFIDNPEALEACGKAGYERVKNMFTMEAMVDNLEEHLRNKIAEKTGGQ
ncbi:MAG TPA: glycosyltransferase [Chlorobaculum parvum]|uniref:Glycosyltransferase n=1 Tax=Chlorobaculum parvum TaxID=274539 RepID=A0A7C5DI32_9CHLB|nr:glycosyltransferase [Chlorobaculum parvum]